MKIPDEVLAAAGLCPACGKPHPTEIVESTVTVGAQKRTESVSLHYCQDCRNAFLAEMNTNKKS